MKTIQETWAPVPRYEGYYVINPSGSVKSLHKNSKGNIIGQIKCLRSGYLTVKLSKKGTDSTQSVHRLLAMAFIPNPQNKPFVNHIDGNKLNNQLENLAWVTHSENMKHAFLLGLAGDFKSKAVVDECTGKKYSSIKVAAQDYGLEYATLKNYLNGNRNNPTCLRLASKAMQDIRRN